MNGIDHRPGIYAIENDDEIDIEKEVSNKRDSGFHIQTMELPLYYTYSVLDDEFLVIMTPPY